MKCFVSFVGIYWIIELKNYKYCCTPCRYCGATHHSPLHWWMLIQCNGHYILECWLSVGAPSALRCWLLSVECHTGAGAGATGCFRPHSAHFVPADTRQNYSHFWYCCCVTQLENKKDKNCFFCLSPEGRWNEIIRVHLRSLKFSARARVLKCRFNFLFDKIGVASF